MLISAMLLPCSSPPLFFAIDTKMLLSIFRHYALPKPRRIFSPRYVAAQLIFFGHHVDYADAFHYADDFADAIAVIAFDACHVTLIDARCRYYYAYAAYFDDVDYAHAIILLMPLSPAFFSGLPPAFAAAMPIRHCYYYAMIAAIDALLSCFSELF